ncbi:hypothetical protein K2X05_07990 [bacterium]|nr:hypothetical protein [bacterium]
MNDQDLKNLLSEYRDKNPSDLQLQRWKNAIAKEQLEKPQARSIWFQLVACSIVSFVLGAIAFNMLQTKEESLQIANNFDDDATIEYVFHK